MFFLQRIIFKDYLRTFLKEELSFFRIYTSSRNCYSFNYTIPRKRIFIILRCFFKIFHPSRILVELVETNQNMKKFFSYFDGQVSISAIPQPPWLLQVPSFKITRCFKTIFEELLECMFICTEQTNKQR